MAVSTQSHVLPSAFANLLASRPIQPTPSLTPAVSGRKRRLSAMLSPTVRALYDENSDYVTNSDEIEEMQAAEYIAHAAKRARRMWDGELGEEDSDGEARTPLQTAAGPETYDNNVHDSAHVAETTHSPASTCAYRSREELLEAHVGVLQSAGEQLIVERDTLAAKTATLENENRILKRAVATLARHKCSLESQLQQAEVVVNEYNDELRRQQAEIERLLRENAQLVAFAHRDHFAARRFGDDPDSNHFEGNNLAF